MNSISDITYEDVILVDTTFRTINEICDDMKNANISSLIRLVNFAADIQVAHDHGVVSGVAISIIKAKLNRKVLIDTGANSVRIYSDNSVEPLIDMPMINPVAKQVLDTNIPHLGLLLEKFSCVEK